MWRFNRALGTRTDTVGRLYTPAVPFRKAGGDAAQYARWGCPAVRSEGRSLGGVAFARASLGNRQRWEFCCGGFACLPASLYLRRSIAASMRWGYAAAGLLACQAPGNACPPRKIHAAREPGRAGEEARRGISPHIRRQRFPGGFMRARWKVADGALPAETAGPSAGKKGHGGRMRGCFATLSGACNGPVRSPMPLRPGEAAADFEDVKPDQRRLSL